MHVNAKFWKFRIYFLQGQAVKKTMKNEYIKQLIKLFMKDSFLWPLDLVANECETFKILHLCASLMKYMDFNGLNLSFKADLIYFWSCAHQTLLVSMSHPSFAQLNFTK